jgi:hypothetical protein
MGEDHVIPECVDHGSFDDAPGLVKLEPILK